MWRIFCLLVILGTHKKCHGIFTQKDDSKRELHRPHWNYLSQSQNENIYQTENSQTSHSQNGSFNRSEKNHRKNYVEFGLRLKPRVRQIRILSEHSVEGKKSPSVNNQMPLSRVQNLQNRKITELSTPLEILEYSDVVQNSSIKKKRLVADTKEPVKISGSQRRKKLENNGLNSLEIYDLQNAESQGFGRRVSRNDVENSYNQNRSQKVNENFVIIKTKPMSLISFRSRQNQNGQYISDFRKIHRQKYRRNFEVQSEKTFESNCTATSHILFIRKPGLNSVKVNGQNTFKGPGYLPPRVETTTVFKGDEYLPPTVTETSKSCHNCGEERSITTFITTKRPNVAIRHPLYIKTITKHPFYIKTNINNTKTTNEEPRDYLTPPKRPYCHTCISTSGPLYIPVTKATPNVPSKPNVTDSPTDSTKDGDIVKNMTTTTVKISRGDIPDDEDDTEDTTTPKQGAVAPAMAMPVPPESDEPVTTMTSTTLASAVTSTTSNRTPPNMYDTTKFSTTTDSTTNRIESMSTPDDNRHLIEDSPSLTTTIDTTPTTTPVPFKASQYLPPKEPKMPVLNMTSADAEPAMAMPVPPEPEDESEVSPPTKNNPSTVTSTASTITTTLITTLTIPDDDRNLLDDYSTTTMNAMETTTFFNESEYLPPEVPATLMPAMAMPVPLEPEDDATPTPSSTTISTSPTITSTTISTTTSTKPSQTMTIPDENRNLLEDSDTTTPTNVIETTTIFKGSEYLPPGKSTTNIPSVSIASTPTTTNITDDSSSTTPMETTTIFKGSEYLPPEESTTKIPSSTGSTTTTTNLIDDSSSTTTPMETTTIFKGSEYLPPKEPGTIMPAEPAPAMAMPVPPEPEDDATPSPSPTTISTPSITASTTSTTTISMEKTDTMTIPDDNRHLLEESTSTTPMATVFKGPEYLPPIDSTQKIPPNTTLPNLAPALAMQVPSETPESEDLPTVDTNRAAESTSTPYIPDTNPFKGPEYLPPKEGLPPSPAMAMPVLQETDCSLDPNDSPNIDPRSSAGDPCVSTTSKPTTKGLFKGPLYLPPKI